MKLPVVLKQWIVPDITLKRPQIRVPYDEKSHLQ